MATPFELYDFFKISIIEDTIGNVSKNLSLVLKDFDLTKEKFDKVDFKKVCATKIIPYNPSKIKLLLYTPQTNPKVTIFFPNFTDGWYTAINRYAMDFKKNVFKLDLP